jgi:hypothetical protein
METNTMKLHVSGTLEIRVDDPVALADASQVFLLDPDHDFNNLDLLTPEAMRNITNALKMVSANHIRAALERMTLPGAVVVGVPNLTVGEEPPQT